MWASLLLVVAVVTAVRGEDMMEVTIRQGPVRGYKIPGSDVFAFYGIPYATAPLGPHKFRPPLPPPEWSKPLEATNIVSCMQVLPSPSKQEDCLVANVYVPDTDEKKLPVVVLVHGGAFQNGFGTAAEPTTLVNSKKFIAVSFNYRLAAQGFLCLGTKDIPGNAGMKDQVALFRWVKENIASFGGNPEDVTIDGCSAGGASVDLHTVSLITNGLFKKTITGSGGNVGAFAVQIDPVENAKYFAKLVGFEDVDNITALEEFYKSASFETLVSNQDVVTGRPDATVIFSPCVEADLGEEMFLNDAPSNILSRKENRGYTMLYGFSDLEGLMFLSSFDNWKDKMDEDFTDYLPADLEFNSEDEKQEVINKIKAHYFPNGIKVRDHMLGFLEYYTDTLFVYPMLRSVKLNSATRNNTVYLFEYSFTNDDAFVVPNTTRQGANHCDQRGILERDIQSDKYLAMKAIMTEIYIDFVTTGNPTPDGSSILQWPPTGGNRVPNMQLDSEPKLWQETRWATDLWDEIYEKYYKAPVPPSTASVP